MLGGSASAIELWDSLKHKFPPIGTAGFDPPKGEFDWQQVGGADNWLLLQNGQPRPPKLEIEVANEASGNRIVVGQDSFPAGKVAFLGNRNIVVFTGANPWFNATCYCCGNDGAMFFGARATANHVTAWTHGDNTMIAVGQECMLSHGIMFRTSDDHAIFDLSSGAHLNSPQSIIIEPRVWLCPEVHVLKGSSVGYGSIVGERSVVTSSVERCTLAVGVPARTIRTNVSWDRLLVPRTAIWQTVLAEMHELPPRHGRQSAY
jgi:acetyltransferase-like isoleucine patch superfamily enzyme